MGRDGNAWTKEAMVMIGDKKCMKYENRSEECLVVFHDIFLNF